MRIGFLTTHPIQYQAPLFRMLSRRPGVRLTALFCLDHGLRPSYDPGFKKMIQYDVPLLEGYEHRFLRNLARRPGFALGGMINPEIVTILARGDFDAVIVHGYASATNLICLSAPRGRTRLLFRGESNLQARRSVPRRVAKQVLMRTLLHRVDHFLSIGSLNSAYYEAYGVRRERITLAPYSVDNDFFIDRSAAARLDREVTRQQLGLPERRTLFVSAAKVVSKKRPFDLLEGFVRAGISQRAGLVYVGDGDLIDELRHRVQSLGLSESVQILGFRNQTELPQILGACDALVLPSDFEPWGLIVNEAMACGAAAIVSDQVGSGPDLVGDARCTFPVGDVEHLGRILCAMVDQPDLLRQLKSEASGRIAHWGLEQTADGVLRGVEAALRS